MTIKLERLDRFRWLIPKTGGMKVPGLIFSDAKLLKDIQKGQSITQVVNVASLPGIVSHSLAMPDIHWGYGFPIGGVAAFHPEEGVISPGGVGYDINCGCRLMTTRLKGRDIRPVLKKLVAAFFKNVPCGVGSSGPLQLSRKDQNLVALEGAAWAVKKGFGSAEDLVKTEDGGAMQEADPAAILSERAFKRGKDQLGTLGSGNHFIEIQMVDQVYDHKKADAFGLFEGQVTVLIHSGSRGFGHQICDDFLKEMSRFCKIDLPDRQLACAPLKSDQGKRYFSAMACAANYAWANRQIIMHLIHEAFLSSLSISPKELGVDLLYDVCHNIAKKEAHYLGPDKVVLCVHRKGATRALPPGHDLLPPVYRNTGQPVLIPGNMGTNSYVLAGAERAMAMSFSSTCHGAGRNLSRNQAVKKARGRAINRELEDKGIYVLSRGTRTLKEEMPDAYKDINRVVDVVHGAGLARKVVRLKPLGVIKG